jgi:hypothetical protein
MYLLYHWLSFLICYFPDLDVRSYLLDNIKQILAGTDTARPWVKTGIQLHKAEFLSGGRWYVLPQGQTLGVTFLSSKRMDEFSPQIAAHA